MPEIQSLLVPNNVSYYETESTHWENYWDEESKSVKGGYVTHEAHTIVEQYYTTVIDNPETNSRHPEYRYAHFKLTVENSNTAAEQVTEITDLDRGRKINLPSLGDKPLSRNRLMGRLVMFYISMRNSCDIYGIYHPFKENPVGHSVSIQFAVPRYIDQDLRYMDYNDPFESYRILADASVPSYKYCMGTDERYARTEVETNRGYWYCYPVICVLNMTDPDNPYSVYCNASYNSEGKLVVKSNSLSLNIGYLPPGKYRAQWIFTGATLYPRGVTYVDFEVLDLKQYDYFYQSGYSLKNGTRNLMIQFPVLLERLYYQFAYTVTQEAPEFVPVQTVELPKDSDFPKNSTPDSRYYGNRQYGPGFIPFKNKKPNPGHFVFTQTVQYKKGITALSTYTSQPLPSNNAADPLLSDFNKYFTGSSAGEYRMCYKFENWDTQCDPKNGTVLLGYWKYPANAIGNSGSSSFLYDQSGITLSSGNNNYYWYRYQNSVRYLNAYRYFASGKIAIGYNTHKSSTVVTDSFDQLSLVARAADALYETAVSEEWNGSNVSPSTPETIVYLDSDKLGFGYDLDTYPKDIKKMAEIYKNPTPLDDYLNSAYAETGLYSDNSELPMGSHIRVSRDYSGDFFSSYPIRVAPSELMGIKNISERTYSTTLFSNLALPEITPYEIEYNEKTGSYSVKYNFDCPIDQNADENQTTLPYWVGNVDWSGYEHHIYKACWLDGITSSSIGRAKGFQVGDDRYIPQQ